MEEHVRWIHQAAFVDLLVLFSPSSPLLSFTPLVQSFNLFTATCDWSSPSCIFFSITFFCHLLFTNGSVCAAPEPPFPLLLSVPSFPLLVFRQGSVFSFSLRLLCCHPLSCRSLPLLLLHRLLRSVRLTVAHAQSSHSNMRAHTVPAPGSVSWCVWPPPLPSARPLLLLYLSHRPHLFFFFLPFAAAFTAVPLQAGSRLLVGRENVSANQGGTLPAPTPIWAHTHKPSEMRRHRKGHESYFTCRHMVQQHRPGRKHRKLVKTEPHLERAEHLK